MSDSPEAFLAELDDWRGARLAHLRELILRAEPDVVEEIKWRKPSNPAGVLAWTHGKLICTGEVYKDKVKLTFAHGALLADPGGVFNASLDAGTRRALDLREDDPLDDDAFVAVIRDAVRHNAA